MKLKHKVLSVFSAAFCYAMLVAQPVFASSGQDIAHFTSDTMQLIFLFASLIATVFLVKGGYLYMISSGSPDKLESAKKTIRNALIGLLLVLSATTISTVLHGALSPDANTATQTISLPKIQEAPPAAGISQVLTNAITGFLQNIVQSATKPLIDGIIGFLTTTPTLLSNQTIVHFWLITVGIADTLFVLVVALLGLQVMSTSTLGYEETTLPKILPRLIIAFLGMHASLFLMDLVISLCNALTTTLLNVTGGIDHAWVLNAFSTNNLFTSPQSIPLITLLFLVLFMILSVVLLLMYITRLITIGLAAVLSPFIFLLWAMPRFSDFAEISMKSYVVSVFIVFVHLVIIQLASAMIAVPGENIKDNAFLAVLVGIGLFFMLLKTPSLMMQLIMYTKGNSIVRIATSQVINVMRARRTEEATAQGSPSKGEIALA